MTSRILSTGLAALLAVSFTAASYAQPGGGGMMRQAGLIFPLLTIDRVQEELKLDDNQKDAIGDFVEEAQSTMREKFQDAMGGERGGRRGGQRGGMGGAMQEIVSEMRKWEDERLSELLEDEQLTRLKQIHWQNRGAQALLEDEVVEKLGLKEEQKTQIRTKMQENAERMSGLMGEMRDNPQEGRQQMQRIRQELDQQLMNILDEEQKRKFEELKGERFELPQQQRGQRGGGRRDF